MDSSRGGNAAIDVQNFAVDEGRRAAQQKGTGVRIILLAAEPPQGNGGAERRSYSALSLSPSAPGGRHRTRCDGIDADIPRPQFRRQHLVSVDDRVLSPGCRPPCWENLFPPRGRPC